ncbi:MAG TPA: ATP-binding protein [Acidobacteriaceae bacterium]
MDAQTISTLLADLESDRIERTISTNNGEKFAQAICAFANDFPNNKMPGYLVIGADDQTGQPSGLRVTDELLQRLGALRSDGNIQPLPAIAVQKVVLEGNSEVAVVEVQPSDLPPVRYRGRIWIRVGPRKAIASEQEERILSEKRLSAAKTFDARPCLESSIDDLSVRLFEVYRGDAVATEIIEENHRTIKQQLASLRFFDTHRAVPTNAGILLFGTNSRFFLPGAYVQYLRLPNKDLTDVPKDQAEISGDMQSILEELLLRVRVLNTHDLQQLNPLREGLKSNYPEVAVREILLNAVVHRSYESNTPIRFSVFSDRLEIISPGGLYGEVDIQNFGTQSSYRNPVIAEALKVLGFVNRFGYGIRRAQRALAENGSKPLGITINNAAVLITIWALEVE